MKMIFLGLVFLKTATGMAQDSTGSGPLKFSVYVEAYHSYDLNKPVNNEDRKSVV